MSAKMREISGDIKKDENKLFMMVVAHKEFDDSIIRNDGYRVIKVGDSVSDQIAQEKKWIVDKGNLGDISDENPYYCELTAQYWAWKNLPSNYSIVGLSHYRRYFFKYKRKSKVLEEDIVSSEEIYEILKKYQVIMAYPTVKYPGKGKLYKNKSMDEQDKHWLIIDKVIKEKYEDYYETFKKVIYGHFNVWGNMFITSREFFNDYSEWIFGVLKEYDMEIEKKGEKRIPRVDAFLAELLLLVWISKNIKFKDIYFLEVRNTETDSFYEYTHKGIKAKLIRIIRCNHILLSLARWMRILVLLYKRREKRKA